MDDLIFVGEAELSRALANTVLSPDETFDLQARRLMAAIRANKGKSAPPPRMQLDS